MLFTDPHLDPHGIKSGNASSLATKTLNARYEFLCPIVTKIVGHGRPVLRFATGATHDSKVSISRITKQKFHSLVLNSPRSRKKSDHNAVKFSYDLNFRHSRFNYYLFTIHSQGVLHFTPHGIPFNHDSRKRFLPNHDSQSTEKPAHGVRKILLPPLPPPPPPLT